MSEDMVSDGYQRIVNIDISNVVIQAMSEKYRHNPRLICTSSSNSELNNFIFLCFSSLNCGNEMMMLRLCVGRVMDVMKMDFLDCEFDAVIDKGTMDAILVIFSRFFFLFLFLSLSFSLSLFFSFFFFLFLFLFSLSLSLSLWTFISFFQFTFG
jgi:hypothetical protein